MPVYDEDALPLMEEFLRADAIDAQAMRDLVSLVKSGCKDQKMIDSAVSAQTKAHNKAMDIYDKLQETRLDK